MSGGNMHAGLEQDIARRRAQLSPEQQALLQTRLTAAVHPGVPATTIEKRPPDAMPVLSFAQEQHWILNQLQCGNPCYHVPRAYRIAGPLNVMVFVRCINELVNRHEGLRTTFRVAGADPVPVISPQAAIPLPLQDLSHLPQAERESRAREIVVEEVRPSFDLVRGPLLRAHLIALSANEHVLAVTAHHIIADDWSMRLFINELMQLYDTFLQGKPADLPELPIQYSDYAHWQRHALTDTVCESHLAYFRGQLAGAPPVLALPCDHSRPPVQTYAGAQQQFQINATLESSLVDLAQRERATLFMVIMAAFHVLLHRYTRQDDIVVGYPVAGRDRLELEGIFGNFVNTLVLRASVAGNPSFRDFLGQVRTQVLDAHAHRSLPFAKLVEAIQPERASGHSPIFQAMLVLEDARSRREISSQLSFSEFEFDPGVAPLDFMLEVMRFDTALSCAFTYNTDLFEADTVARMAGHLQSLLHAIVENPDAHVGELTMLTHEERCQLLDEWNDTRTDLPWDLCLHQFVESQAARTPDAVALVCGDVRLTYQELNSRADTLADRLPSLGPEALVGIFMNRSPAMVVSLLATLKAGAAYVPLDPAYPSARLAQIMDDAQLAAILTHSELKDRLPRTNARVVCVDQDLQSGGAPAFRNTARPPAPEALAYVIYTSGSTGRPKGVAITHGNACNFMHWARRFYSDEALRGVLCCTSINFDLFVFELFAPLCWGGAVILADNVFALPSLPARDEVTLISTVPSAMAEFVRSAVLPACVTTVSLAGEPLHPELVDRLYDLGVQHVYDLYGPTETTVYSTAVRRHKGGPATVGRPIINTCIYILDSYRQPVPVGVPGELYIGGAGVARGYLNRPELTAEKFTHNPFSEIAGDRIYATGDLARYLPDGNIQLLGRMDYQVKIRGYRIELGDIENALVQQAGVRDAVVVVREMHDDKQLVAYVVWDAPNTFGDQALRDALKPELPEYMIPAAFVALETLPRMPNGKIDRKCLPDPGLTRRAGLDTYVAPRTEQEAIIAKIWSEMLKRGQVGVHDNFFELGGHSLLGARVVARIQQLLQKELPLLALFLYPTVAELAAQIEWATYDMSLPALPALEPIPRDQPLPLSFAQERLWFVDRLQPNSATYNTAAKYRIRGRLDVEALDQALQRTANRHEILRTTFPSADGMPLQVIAPEIHIPLPLEDVQHLAGDVQAREVERVAHAEARKPFDLATGPLLRLRLIRLNELEQVLVLVMNHVVSDGWSRGLFMHELLDRYQAVLSGSSAPPRALPVQYADFAAWQRRCMEAPIAARQRAYWLKALAGPPPNMDLPSDRLRPAIQSNHGASLDVRLPRTLADSLRKVSQDSGVTLFMTLLAAFQALIHRYTGLDDITVAAPIGMRPRAELENLVGLFVNTLALRTRIAGDPPFRSLLDQVKETVLGAYENQNIPFEKVVEELRLRRDPSRAPLTQVMFAFQNFPESPLHAPGLDVTYEHLATGTARADLVLFLHDRENGLEGEIEYNTDLFDVGNIESLLHDFDRLLNAIVDDPQRPISQLPLTGSHRAAPAAEPVVAPRCDASEGLPDHLASALTSMWEDLLGVHPIGLHDDFFEIGGSSLKAIQLVDRMEKEMGIRVPVVALFLGPTIAKLARALVAGATAAPRCAPVLLRPGDSGHPMFWIHSVTGRVELYYRLAQAMVEGRPVYGIPAAKPPLADVEAMAASYVRQIREVQPVGPYLLGGYCFGGVVAFETARQLVAAGESVALLALVESVASNTGPHPVRELPGLGFRLFMSLPAIGQAMWRNVPRAKRKLNRIRANVLQRVRPSIKSTANGADEILDTEEFWEGHRAHVRSHAQALGKYVPRQADVKVTLFKSGTFSLHHLDPYMGWQKLAKRGVEIHVIPGKHDNLLDERHLPCLAQQLNETLRAFDAKGRVP